MINPDLFFLTEVKGQNVHASEKIGNFFLRPVQYLWKGKKIDFIQSGPNFAVQKDKIYRSYQRSWLKTVFMVIGLIPGTILGAAFKLHATLKYHTPEHDALIMTCLQPGNQNLQIISNDNNFAQEVTSFITALGEYGIHEQRIILYSFLSEIKGITLADELSRCGNGIFVKDHKRNQYILKNIHFLWNLSILNVGNRYSSSFSPRDEIEEIKTAVINKNPSIRYTAMVSDGNDRNYRRAAVDFFSEFRLSQRINAL